MRYLHQMYKANINGEECSEEFITGWWVCHMALNKVTTVCCGMAYVYSWDMSSQPNCDEEVTT